MNRYYVYQDWSHVPPQQSDMISIEKDESMHPAAQRLPSKLNKMLEDSALSGIVEWRPHGRSWRIVDRDEFISKALPVYFQHSNFTSFVRLVNAWGFRRVTYGKDSDSYYHELFLRGMRHLHIRMRRLTMDERKAPVEQCDRCPEFYSMSTVENARPGSFLTMSSSSDNAVASPGHFSVASTLNLHQQPLTSTGVNISSPSQEIAIPNQINDFSNHAENNNPHMQASYCQTMNHNLSLRNQSSITMQHLSFNSLPIIPDINEENMRQCYLNTSSPGIAQHGVLLIAKPSQSIASLRSDFFVSRNATAATTAGSVTARNRNDPLVTALAKILLPRAQNTGVPRNNEELVDMLIEEWHDSPTCGRENEHKCLHQLLVGRSRRLQQSIPNDSHRRNVTFGYSVGSQSSAHASGVDANQSRRKRYMTTINWASSDSKSNGKRR